MLISTIIFIIVLVLLLIIAIKVLRSIVKAVLSVVLLLFVVSIIFGFFIVQDANNFKTTFQEEDSLYVLSENGEIYTGFSARAFDFDTFEDKSVTEIQDVLDDDSYVGKIILISPTALDFTLDENSDSSIEDILSNDEESLRAAAFKFALFNTISDEGPLFLLNHLRDDSIDILPNSLVVRTITFTPKLFFSSAKEKISSETIRLTNMIPFVGDSDDEDNVTIEESDVDSALITDNEISAESDSSNSTEV